MSICRARNCSLCCHDREVVLTKQYIIRLRTYAHYEQVFARDSRHGMNLKELLFVNGDCVFLRNGQCSVYDNRPTACRIFPYNYDGNRGGLDDECPHVEEFRTDAAFLGMAKLGMDEIIHDVEATIRGSRSCDG